MHEVPPYYENCGSPSDLAAWLQPILVRSTRREGDAVDVGNKWVVLRRLLHLCPSFTITFQAALAAIWL